MSAYRIVHSTCGRLTGYCVEPIFHQPRMQPVHCCWCEGELGWSNTYIESERQRILRRAEELKAELKRIVDFHQIDMLRPPGWQQWTNSYY